MLVLDAAFWGVVFGQFLKEALQNPDGLNARCRNDAIISLAIIGKKGYSPASAIIRECYTDDESENYAPIVAETILGDEKASAKKVCQNRKIPAFNFIEKEIPEIVDETGLTALFNEMSTNPKALLPSFEDNYHKWLEYMFISFVATLEIPDYDPEANMVLEVLLKKIKVA